MLKLKVASNASYHVNQLTSKYSSHCEPRGDRGCKPCPSVLVVWTWTKLNSQSVHQINQRLSCHFRSFLSHWCMWSSHIFSDKFGFNSTEEVMFSLCSSVCSLAGPHKNYWTDCHDIWWRNVLWVRKEPPQNAWIQEVYFTFFALFLTELI